MDEHSPDWPWRGGPHLWLPYTQMKTVVPPLPVVATEGTRIRLADGRELIDGIASWWTACHGYNHPHIAAALRRQTATMPHIMFGGLVHEPACRLAARLCDLLPGNLSRVFFSDSGSVAVEIALKMAVQYWINRGFEGRRRFVSFRNAYHGDTAGAMAVCDPGEGMHRLFRGYLPRHFTLDIPHDEAAIAGFGAFLAKHREEIAGVIVEPLVQAAGGMKFHEPEVLAAVAAATREAGLLFIADEIATGFGRTGTMFAGERAGLRPDIVCLGKALTGGVMSLAATVATAAVFEAFLSDDPAAALMHGPTYMANPLACAAANASLDLFEDEPRLEQVAVIESALKDGLAPARHIEGVAEVRVLGAIGVVQLAPMRRIDWLKRRFVEEGAWLRPFGDVVYLMPPFVISKSDLARLAGVVVKVLEEWASLPEAAE
jgi:adenosylmethionine-8-amino-7-oxononanoate aminotransferase